MKSKKVMAIVPVYNEARNLHRTLNPLTDMMKKGKIDNIIAINDGSTDNSQDKLEAYLENPNFINIVLPKNYGKAYAFYRAAKVCYQMGADIILSLDADLLDISEEQIDMLIGPIIEDNNINMVIGTVKDCSPYVSGQRTIRTQSLDILFDSNKQDKDWLYLFSGIKINKKGEEKLISRVGYGLEWILNDFIEKEFLCMTDFSHHSKKIFKHIEIVETWFIAGIPSFSINRDRLDLKRSHRYTHEFEGIIEKLKRYFGIKERGFC